jgi:hypothetical protein
MVDGTTTGMAARGLSTGYLFGYPVTREVVEFCRGAREWWVMEENRNIDEPKGRRPPWMGFVRPVWILVFALLLLLLGQSMRHHHFFDGATYRNRNGGTRP